MSIARKHLTMQEAVTVFPTESRQQKGETRKEAETKNRGNTGSKFSRYLVELESESEQVRAKLILASGQVDCPWLHGHA